MLNTINAMFSPVVGAKVKVKYNNSNHGYVIGSEYLVAHSYMHADVGRHSYGSSLQLILIDPQTGMNGNHISPAEVEMDLSKEHIISELQNIIEFLKDTDKEVTDIRLDKEYKVYKILKEMKSTKSDYEKIEIIAKYL